MLYKLNMIHFNIKVTCIRLIALSISLSFSAHVWANDEDIQARNGGQETQTICDPTEDGPYAGLITRSITGWSGLVSENGELPVDTILVMRWFSYANAEEGTIEYERFNEWGAAIKYVLSGQKKKANSYGYTISQRATHINTNSKTETNILRVNAGLDKKIGLDYYIAYSLRDEDFKVEDLPQHPEESFVLTCGLNVLTLD